MNQSTTILSFIAAAFVIFITVRGELPVYLGFILGSGTGAAPKTGASAAQTKSSDAGWNDYLKFGANVIEAAAIAL